MSARNTTRDSVDELPEVSLARNETPSASPSARPWMTRPKVSGNARPVEAPTLSAAGAGLGELYPARSIPSSCSRSPSSASNSRSEDVCCRSALTVCSARASVCECEWACGETSCSIMSMNVKPNSRERAICDVGSLVGFASTTVSIPLRTRICWMSETQASSRCAIHTLE